MSTRLAQRLRACTTLVFLDSKHLSYLALIVGMMMLWPLAAEAHVGLDSPNGGESLTGGSLATIEWHVEIRHNTLDWDLWYSGESSDGPWEEIAVDLPAGNIDDGAPHSFDWTVPNVDLSSAWVRVRQDNAGEDYYDVSDASFSIAAMLGGGDFTGDGSVDAADLMAWENGYGSASATPRDGDADLDADVDGADFLTWQNEVNASILSVADAQVQVVPEPSATLLLVLGMLIMLWHRTRTSHLSEAV